LTLLESKAAGDRKSEGKAQKVGVLGLVLETPEVASSRIETNSGFSAGEGFGIDCVTGTG